MEGKNFSNQKNALRRETKNQNNSKKVLGRVFFLWFSGGGNLGSKMGLRKGICEYVITSFMFFIHTNCFSFLQLFLLLVQNRKRIFLLFVCWDLPQLAFNNILIRVWVALVSTRFLLDRWVLKVRVGPPDFWSRLPSSWRLFPRL